MIKKKILAGVFSVLALSAVIGANLANAAGDTGAATSVEQQATGTSGADNDSIEFEGVNEGNEANEANGAEEAEGAEAAGGTESDSHEDVGENTDHQCPPDCDTAAGETP